MAPKGYTHACTHPSLSSEEGVAIAYFTDSPRVFRLGKAVWYRQTSLTGGSARIVLVAFFLLLTPLL